MIMLHPAAPPRALPEPRKNDPGPPRATQPDPHMTMPRLIPPVPPDRSASQLRIANMPGHLSTIEHAI